MVKCGLTSALPTATGLVLFFCGHCRTILLCAVARTESRKQVFDILQRYFVTGDPNQKLTVVYDFSCGKDGVVLRSTLLSPSTLLFFPPKACGSTLRTAHRRCSTLCACSTTSKCCSSCGGVRTWPSLKPASARFHQTTHSASCSSCLACTASKMNTEIAGEWCCSCCWESARYNV